MKEETGTPSVREESWVGIRRTTLESYEEMIHFYGG